MIVPKEYHSTPGISGLPYLTCIRHRNTGVIENLSVIIVMMMWLEVSVVLHGLSSPAGRLRTSERPCQPYAHVFLDSLVSRARLPHVI